MSNIFGIPEEKTIYDNIGLHPDFISGHVKTQNTHESDDVSLSIEDVCMSLAMRGGFTGKYSDLVRHVKQFLNEATYQLREGYAINTGYFILNPNASETFNCKNDCSMEN